MTSLLLPQPRELSGRQGTFSFDAETLIFLPAATGAAASDGIFFAARQLQEEIRAATGLRPPIVKAYAPPRRENTILLICGQEQAASFGIDPIVTDLPQAVAEQAYALTLTPYRAVLYAPLSTTGTGSPGLFYAVQTLRQLVRLAGRSLPALVIRDWPALPYRGLMLDVSRRKVPTLDTLMQLVAELSHYKLNVLQLYTEYTFQFPRHPKIGAGCGSLSSQDILELDAWCQLHQVELMPNLQSFGHARNTLKIADYRHLAETDLLWTLSPAFEETYTLLEELYGDMLPAFSSATFNVGCDETYDLGQGASQALVEKAGGGRDGVARVYLNHILRLRKLAAGHGRRIQIWGDILLHHPDLIPDLPEDVTLLDWHYDAAVEYPTVETFAQAGRPFWVCPGVGSWNSLFPRLYAANVNIRNLVRDGVAAGAEGMLNTDWGDFGHYQYQGLSWYGYLFGAAQSWTGGATEAGEFETALGPLFFGPDEDRILEAMHQLARTNQLPGIQQPNRSLTVLALFDEPLTGATVVGDDALLPETLRDMYAFAEYAAAVFDEVERGHPRSLTLREMASAARLTAYAARKTRVSQAIRTTLRQIAQAQEPAQEQAARLDEHIRALAALDAELEALRAEFEALWLSRARRSEIHVSLGYFARLRARYTAAIAWLEGQRQVVLAGQPVDAELASYDADDYKTLWQTWPEGM
jgi:hypothetical protein